MALAVAGKLFIAVFIYSVSFTYALIVQLQYITTKLYHPDGTDNDDVAYTFGELYVSIYILPVVVSDIENCLVQEFASLPIYLLPYVQLPVVRLLHSDIDQADWLNIELNQVHMFMKLLLPLKLAALPIFQDT